MARAGLGAAGRFRIRPNLPITRDHLYASPGNAVVGNFPVDFNRRLRCRSAKKSNRSSAFAAETGPGDR
jgi:hypothetical protein